MSPSRHAAHGWGLLAVGAGLCVLLWVLFIGLMGFAPGGGGSWLIVGIMALIGLGVGWLWHSGRVRLAWTALLIGPGLLVLLGLAALIFALSAYPG